MGVLERDNGPVFNGGTGRQEYKNENAPSLAVTDRVNTSKMMGG